MSIASILEVCLMFHYDPTLNTDGLNFTLLMWYSLSLTTAMIDDCWDCVCPIHGQDQIKLEFYSNFVSIVVHIADLTVLGSNNFNVFVSCHQNKNCVIPSSRRRPLNQSSIKGTWFTTCTYRKNKETVKLILSFSLPFSLRFSLSFFLSFVLSLSQPSYQTSGLYLCSDSLVLVGILFCVQWNCQMLK